MAKRKSQFVPALLDAVKLPAIVLPALILPALIVGAGSLQAAEPVKPEHAAQMKAGMELFRQEVRQILTGRCLKCHGGEKRESEFDLNTREALLKGGAEGAAVDLKAPGESRMLGMIEHRVEPHMPANAARLPDRQIASIRKWIELGAPYDRPLVDKGARPDDWVKNRIDPAARDFWSFQPLQPVQVPAIPAGDWALTDIDRFVVAKQAEAKLTARPRADRRTLIRRLYFDLTGLPPAPAEVERFVNNSNPKAYEQLVDQLLASPQYGERWARHWLDLVRFAESHGFEQDYDRPHAYHYRDFVIWALNHDLPYDQFVRWQLAGDEWEPENSYAQMATGFLGAGVFPTQLTEKEFESARYDELDDMLATVGTSMLGLTIGCARCHDHKFDPIPSADYYRMLASFTTAIRAHVELDLNPGPHREALAKWETEHQPLVEQLQMFEKAELPARFDRWLKAAREKSSQSKDDVGQSSPDKNAPVWIIASPTEVRSQNGQVFTRQADGSYVAGGANPDFDTVTFTITTQMRGLTAMRLEAMANEGLARNGPGRAENGNFALGRISATVEPLDKSSPAVEVKLKNPRATFQQNDGGLSIASSLDADPKSGWAVDPQFGKNHAAILDFQDPIGFEAGTRLTVKLEFSVNNRHNIGRPRLALTAAAPGVGFDGTSQTQETIELLTIVAAKGELTKAQRDLLMQWYRGTDDTWKQLVAKVDEHNATRPKPNRTQVMVVTEGQKPLGHHADDRGFPHFYPQTHFLKRGDVTQKQQVAEQNFLQVLTTTGSDSKSEPRSLDRWFVPPPEGSKLSHRRRALSAWMTDGEQGAGSLLARVVVNRLWQHHLGRGIVATPNDFGAQGERPTHPELLDYLADRLVRSDWRLKPIHKLIVMSAVYQQDGRSSEAGQQADPENRLLWRYAPRRLEAEVLRDAMLAVSGTLDATMYGPGSLDEGHRRRSIYFMIKRSRLIPSMQILDAPEPLVSIGERPSTTVAPQALMFMNNPHVRSYAAGFASRLLAEKAPENNAGNGNRMEFLVRQAYLSAIGRPPEHAESADARQFLDAQTKRYAADGRANAEQLALADFCQVLFSLNEFAYVE